MAEKEVIIGTGDDQINMLYGTSIKESPDSNDTTSSVQTFSGAIVTGSNEVSYTLEIAKLRYEGMGMHMKLDMKLDDMMNNADNITVIDTVKPKGENAYQVVSRYFNCINTGNDYEIKPDDHTAENLKFKCERREREWKEYSEVE